MYSFTTQRFTTPRSSLPYTEQAHVPSKTCADTLNKGPCTHSEQERSILGTWCHVELMKAIEKGYQI